MSSENRTLTLPTLAWEIIRLMVQQAGWATTHKDILIAANLDDRIALPPKPKPGADGKLDPAEDKAWCEAPATIELMAKECAAITKCIQGALARGAFGGNKTSKAILEAFLPKED